MLILGLTGGISTGKSTTSAILKEKYNFPVVDADIIARQVVEPGRPAYKKIVEHFGKLSDQLLLEDGNLNREVLGRLVFGHEEERQFLNKTVHPAVRKEMLFQVIKLWLQGAKVVVFDVPLLFESHLDVFCGETLVVACSDSLQLERLLKRNTELTKDDAEKRIASQMNMDRKRELADHVIENDGDLKQLQQKIESVIEAVQPNKLLWLLEWLIPPFGLLMGTVTAGKNYLAPKKSRL